MPQVTLQKIKSMYGSDTDPQSGVSNAYLTPQDAITQPCLMYVSAVRNSGKSYAVSKMMRQSKKHHTFDRVFIITPTWLSNKSYFSDIVNVVDVFEPTKDAIDKVLTCVDEERDLWDRFVVEKKRYKEYIALLKSGRELNESQILHYFELGYLDEDFKPPTWIYKVERPPQSAVILDDVLGSKALSQSGSLTRLASLNRHLSPLAQEFVQSDGSRRSACGLAVIILSQTYRMPQGISRTLRENVTHLMLFKNKQERQLKTIKEELGSALDEDKFTIAYELATEKKFGFLIADFNPKEPHMTFRKGLDTYIVFPPDPSD